MNTKRNIVAFLVIGTLGTVSHFVYEWLGKMYVIGLFFPVNESTWEHLKLLFYPALLYFLFEFLRGKEKPQNYITSSVIAIFIGMLSIIIMFYTYQGVIGRNIDFLNIAIYYLGVIVTLYIQNKLISGGSLNSPFLTVISVSYLLLMVILFSGFSYNPPELGIFEPPYTATALI